MRLPLAELPTRHSDAVDSEFIGEPLLTDPGSFADQLRVFGVEPPRLANFFDQSAHRCAILSAIGDKVGTIRGLLTLAIVQILMRACRTGDKIGYSNGNDGRALIHRLWPARHSKRIRAPRRVPLDPR